MNRTDNDNNYIVCVGSALVDCIVKGFDPEPISASGFFAASAELSTGGEALNQAVAFTKMGKKVRIVCFTGEDHAGNIVDSTLKQHGIDISFVRKVPEEHTPVALIFTDDTGDRKSVTNSAHRYNFHPERDMSYMDGAAAVSLGSLFRAPFDDPQVVYEIVSEAKKRGLPVYADTKLLILSRLSLEDFRDSLSMIDCIFPNEKEGRFYSGKDDPEGMADGFLKYGVKSVIVKLGSEGCLYKDGEMTIRLPGLPVTAVDATGAGDNFAAGFISMRSEGRSIEESLRFANTCGALSTTVIGSAGGVRDRSQVFEAMAAFYDRS
ncbi:MAG: carbohydrate kinase family protein [Oscillospiraceae bacterium]|nr:carbohydrate kinase family protein [Oscillospiraceae bacterium]